MFFSVKKHFEFIKKTNLVLIFYKKNRVYFVKKVYFVKIMAGTLVICQ